MRSIRIRVAFDRRRCAELRHRDRVEQHVVRDHFVVFADES